MCRSRRSQDQWPRVEIGRMTSTAPARNRSSPIELYVQNSTIDIVCGPAAIAVYVPVSGSSDLAAA